MRSEVLERLRQTMRGGGTDDETAKAVGTSERAAFQRSVPTRSNRKFQQWTENIPNDFNDVPAVPTVPTQHAGGKTEPSKIEASDVGTGVGTLSERRRNDLATDWWNAPVEGWPHSLTIRNFSTGKETVIDLRRTPAEGVE